MTALPESARDVHARVLAHLLDRIGGAAVWTEPFGHTYFEELLPADVYAALLDTLPPADRYSISPTAPDVPAGSRAVYNLTADALRRFPARCRELWLGVVAALTDPQLKRGLFAKLAPDLIHRYGVKEANVPDLPGFPRPTLYRDAEGFALPPHPDTLKKVVTMHLYLPADLSQLHLGTTLYQPLPGASPRAHQWEGFAAVKKLEFKPNSGYAFVVNDGPTRPSWHGCERLPARAGVRNTLLNAFYAEPRHGYEGYLELAGAAPGPASS
jgi:hypothetical protein